MKYSILYLTFIILIMGCSQRKSAKKNNERDIVVNTSDYKGTASISQGLAKMIEGSMYSCPAKGGRDSNLGLISSTDGKQWKVPAVTNFLNEDFPNSSDLYNTCNGNTYSNTAKALSKLDGSDIVEIDPEGKVYTAYVFADNYFEMYINGVPVGKDNVPYAWFNSSIVRFRVTKPFTIAMKLIDGEESLGLGNESFGDGIPYHCGDAGMVAVFKNSQNEIVAITNENWKAQTFYTSPIKDLSCVSEEGTLRISKNCDVSDSKDISSFYALHWVLPVNWEKEMFDDSKWPKATVYTTETIGVDNKKAYTNFTELFDDKNSDAQFIWSSNVVLDNEVIVRYTLE